MERSEPVHPAAPEVGQGGIGSDDATECNDEEEEEGRIEGGKELIGGEGGDGLAEADVEELEHASHEEHVAGVNPVGKPMP